MYLHPRNYRAEFHPVRFQAPTVEVERRILLLGRSGSGKSASANTLFGRTAFLEARWGRFHTQQCQRGSVVRFGRKLNILDTPGFLLDTDLSDPRVKREIAKTIGITSPGPHVFVFVFPTPHMHKCDVEIFQKFVHVFGTDALNYTILLFSKTDDLDYFSLTKQAFILSAPTEWKAIMKACNYRCVWFQNRSSPIDKELMVKTFLETMETTIHRNMGRYFSNELYFEVERTIIRRDLTQKDQYAKMDKLRKRLRIDLHAAGPVIRHSDIRREAAKSRENLREELEDNNLKIIDSIWNVLKRFPCLQILRHPKLPQLHQQNRPRRGLLKHLYR